MCARLTGCWSSLCLDDSWAIQPERTRATEWRGKNMALRLGCPACTWLTGCLSQMSARVQHGSDSDLICVIPLWNIIAARVVTRSQFRNIAKVVRLSLTLLVLETSIDGNANVRRNLVVCHFSLRLPSCVLASTELGLTGCGWLRFLDIDSAGQTVAFSRCVLQHVMKSRLLQSISQLQIFLARFCPSAYCTGTRSLLHVAKHLGRSTRST
jgi:hypothetical protein